jgi:hypothetical protein
MTLVERGVLVESSGVEHLRANRDGACLRLSSTSLARHRRCICLGQTVRGR